jgi:hypothetical protein
LDRAVESSDKRRDIYNVQPFVDLELLITRISACVETLLGGVSGVIRGELVSPLKTLPDLTNKAAILNLYSEVKAILEVAFIKALSLLEIKSEVKEYCL